MSPEVVTLPQGTSHDVCSSPGQHVSLYLLLSPTHPSPPPECSLMGPDHGWWVGDHEVTHLLIWPTLHAAVQPLRERLNSKLGEWYGYGCWSFAVNNNNNMLFG